MISLIKPSQVVAMRFSVKGTGLVTHMGGNFPVKMNFCQWKLPVTSLRFHSDGIIVILLTLWIKIYVFNGETLGRCASNATTRRLLILVIVYHHRRFEDCNLSFHMRLSTRT